MAENEEKARERARKNKIASYIFMAIFAIVMIGGIVLLIHGISIDVNSSTPGAAGEIAKKVLFCLLGGVLALLGLALFIASIIMATTKFEGRSRNPINNIFKDTVSEFQDMMEDTGNSLVPTKKNIKICPECGQENGANETICTRCGGGLGA